MSKGYIVLLLLLIVREQELWMKRNQRGIALLIYAVYRLSLDHQKV